MYIKYAKEQTPVRYWLKRWIIHISCLWTVSNMLRKTQLTVLSCKIDSHLKLWRACLELKDVNLKLKAEGCNQWGSSAKCELNVELMLKKNVTRVTGKQSRSWPYDCDPLYKVQQRDDWNCRRSYRLRCGVVGIKSMKGRTLLCARAIKVPSIHLIRTA